MSLLYDAIFMSCELFSTLILIDYSLDISPMHIIKVLLSSCSVIFWVLIVDLSLKLVRGMNAACFQSGDRAAGRICRVVRIWVDLWLAMSLLVLITWGRLFYCSTIKNTESSGCYIAWHVGSMYIPILGLTQRRTWSAQPVRSVRAMPCIGRWFPVFFHFPEHVCGSGVFSFAWTPEFMPNMQFAEDQFCSKRRPSTHLRVPFFWLIWIHIRLPSSYFRRLTIVGYTRK